MKFKVATFRSLVLVLSTGLCVVCFPFPVSPQLDHIKHGVTRCFRLKRLETGATTLCKRCVLAASNTECSLLGGRVFMCLYRNRSDVEGMISGSAEH